MKNQFKIVLAAVFMTAFMGFGQTENQTVYSRSYTTNGNTTAFLEFRGSDVEISKSKDDTFYVEYIIEFIDYPNRKKKEAIANVKVESEFLNNRITMTDMSKFSMFKYMRFETLVGRLGDLNKEREKFFEHMSLSEFQNKLNNEKIPVPFYVRHIENSKNYTEDEKKKSIERYYNRRRRRYNKKLKIKIPENLSITINAKASNIRIIENIENQLTFRLDGGKFYTESMSNSKNKIKIKDATLFSSSISGGKLIMDNSKSSMIGKLKDVDLKSEFSEIQIGEINQNNKITDFTSKYIIHNLSQNLEVLAMRSEYSEINMFLPSDSSYYIETYGHNTVHFYDGIKTEIQPSRDNAYSKMMVIGEETNPNKIRLNTIHGIIRFGEDFIDYGN